MLGGESGVRLEAGDLVEINAVLSRFGPVERDYVEAGTPGKRHRILAESNTPVRAACKKADRAVATVNATIRVLNAMHAFETLGLSVQQTSAPAVTSAYELLSRDLDRDEAPADWKEKTEEAFDKAFEAYKELINPVQQNLLIAQITAPRDDADDDGGEIDLSTYEQDEVPMPYFVDFALKVGWQVLPTGALAPIPNFKSDRSIFVVWGKLGCVGKSSLLQMIFQACENTAGYGAINLSHIKLNDLLHQVVKKWGGKDKDGVPKCPKHPYFMSDIARAFSDTVASPVLSGTIETLLTNVTDGKFGGGEHQWIEDKPVVVLTMNCCPIIGTDRKGKELAKPICHLSADRLMGNVFSMEMGPRGFELVQDRYCDALAIKVRQMEEAGHAADLAQMKSTSWLSPKDLFEKFVVSGAPGKFVMDANAPEREWVAYTVLHQEFYPYAPNIKLKGMHCLSKLMAEWYKDEIADGRLRFKDQRRLGDRLGCSILHFSFKQVPRA